MTKPKKCFFDEVRPENTKRKKEKGAGMSGFTFAGVCHFSERGVFIGDPDGWRGALTLFERHNMSAAGKWAIWIKESSNQQQQLDVVFLHKNATAPGKHLSWSPEPLCSLPMRSASGIMCILSADRARMTGVGGEVVESFKILQDGFSARADCMTHLAWGTIDNLVVGIRIRMERCPSQKKSAN